MGWSIHFLCVYMYMAARTRKAAVKRAELESPNEGFSSVYSYSKKAGGHV